MSIELKVPPVGESITEVVIGQWRKGEGDTAEKDENLVEIESDKATVDLPAPAAGTLAKVLKKQGETAAVGEVIGYLEEGGNGQQKAGEPIKADARKGEAPATIQPKPETVAGSGAKAATKEGKSHVMPAAARELAQQGVAADKVQATGPGDRLLKEDVQRHVKEQAKQPAKEAPPKKNELSKPSGQGTAMSQRVRTDGGREEELVPMTPIRRRIAERLVEAQQTAALLTTFNEIDMSEVIALRQKHKDLYTERYGVKLGFMSFFVKASIDALKLVPQVNAEVRDPYIVYRNYYDIGIAVGGGKGLVVPVLRNADHLSFAEIEQSINDFARRAGENKLKLEELQGGTFTISNGGVYGSLLSTPIVNPPQSGILGLHAIQERPVARNGQVVIRPMMYVALTYDHRIVDGREAVTFLKRIKDAIEEPSRILLEV